MLPRVILSDENNEGNNEDIASDDFSRLDAYARMRSDASGDLQHDALAPLPVRARHQRFSAEAKFYNKVFAKFK